MFISQRCHKCPIVCPICIVNTRQKVAVTGGFRWTRPPGTSKSWWLSPPLAHIFVFFHFVSLHRFSAGSLLGSRAMHQWHNLIRNLWEKMTTRSSNHSDSAARGDVKIPSPLCLCHHASRPQGSLLYFLLPLTSLSSPLSPWRKLQLVAFLQGEGWQIHGQTHPHLITHKPLGGQM